MRIAVDIPSFQPYVWKIVGGALEYSFRFKGGCFILLPHAKGARAEDCDPANWDAAIVVDPRPDLDIPQVSIEPLSPASISATVDDDAVVTLAIDQFVSMGLRGFAYTGFPDWDQSNKRWECFSRQTESLGFTPVFINTKDPFEMLGHVPKPCGVLAFSDYMGNLFLRRCKETDFRVPGDFHVISVGDTRKCFAMRPHLSSIVMPYEPVGFEAARLCARMIGGNSATSVKLAPSGLILRDSVKVENDDIKTATEVAHYLRTNLSYPIQMADVVRRSSMSRRKLEGVFRSSYGSSPMAFLKDLRFEEAKEMLRSSDMPLMDIAYKCGYRDSNQICRIFKDRLGITPLNYRESEASE